jgi:hypothetical protein
MMTEPPTVTQTVVLRSQLSFISAAAAVVVTIELVPAVDGLYS